MKRHTQIQRQKETTPLQRGGLLPHAAVRNTPWHDMALNGSEETRISHDLSQTPADTLESLELFPHQSQIELALGVPIAGRAVVSPMECAHRRIPAFTERATAHFATRQPGLKVAAHEATHLVQHAGLTRDFNLGAETHAAAVSRLVAAGHAARDLIGPIGFHVEPAFRPYTDITVGAQIYTQDWDAGMDLRASEDGRMAVGQDSAQHSFWAEPSKITESNTILSDRESVIRLIPQSGTITGKAPEGGNVRTLSKILPQNVANSTTGENMNLWADCGRSGRDVMGAGRGTGGGAMTAVQQKNPWWASIPVLGPLLGWIFGTEEETAATEPGAMKREIFNERLGGTGDEGMRRYLELSGDEQEEFDRETGINRYASPATGEGYTTSTGGSVVPGFELDTWNFHWGGVVMTSGGDRVVLENFAIRNQPLAVNTNWDFQMYGSAAKHGQTFHEQHGGLPPVGTGQHGTAPTTMHVRKR